MRKKSKYTFDTSNRANLFLDRPTMHGGWPEGEYEPSVPNTIHRWMQSMKLTERKQEIRKIIRSILSEGPGYLSHTTEPSIGDLVINTNPRCKHRGSMGRVVRLELIDDDAGKLICYKCLNSGPHWEAGQILRKTMDQLEPYEEFA